MLLIVSGTLCYYSSTIDLLLSWEKTMSGIRLEINCPSCQAILDLAPSAARTVITCDNCQQQLTIPGDSPDQLQESSSMKEPSKDKADDLLKYYTAQVGDDLLYKTKVGQSNRRLPYYVGLFLMLGCLFLCFFFAFNLISGMSSPFLLSPDVESEITGLDVPVPAAVEPDLKMAELFTVKLNAKWREDKWSFASSTVNGRKVGDPISWSSDVKKTDSLVDPIQATITMRNANLDFSLVFVYSWKEGNWKPFKLFETGRSTNWVSANLEALCDSGMMEKAFWQIYNK